MGELGTQALVSDVHKYEKTGLRGFRPGPTQTGLFNPHRRWLEALNFGFRKLRDRTIHIAKTKALITAKLICALVFAYMQKAGFS